jgi:hypothetical protein
MVLDNLQPNRDIRQIEHEIRCYTHFARKQFQVTFADLEGHGRFDLLVEATDGPIEVECKTVNEDTGSQIKVDLTADLSEAFRRCVLKRPPVKVSGLFLLVFKKPTAACKNVAQQLAQVLDSDNLINFDGSDFELRFVARKNWQVLFESQLINELQREIVTDPEVAAHAHCIVKTNNRFLGLVLKPHKPTTLSQRVVDVLKDAADQCSRRYRSVVWLHFVGVAEREFIALAEFSSDGSGAGLNCYRRKCASPECKFNRPEPRRAGPL